MADAVNEEAVGREVARRGAVEGFLGSEIGSASLALAREARSLEVEAWWVVCCWFVFLLGHGSFLARA